MEYISLGNILIKDDILKRHIEKTQSNVDEFVISSNKRACIDQNEISYRQDSLQSLNINIDTKSITDTGTQTGKLIPIIIHFASEEMIDIYKYESNNILTPISSISSDERLSTLSLINSTKFETNTFVRKENNRSCQSEVILSSRIDTKIQNNSSLSISNIVLDRSLSDYKLTMIHRLSQESHEEN